MSHETVWNSRPRKYGKGARSWYEIPDHEEMKMEMKMKMER